MRLSIFGLGYVGAVSCGCFPQLGHSVIGVDVSAEKVARLNQGLAPIAEDRLPELIGAAVTSGQLRATLDTTEAVSLSEAALICVGTPSTLSGGLDGTHLKHVCEEIGKCLRTDARSSFTVMVRSTCLPPLHGELKQLLAVHSTRQLGRELHYVVHPEFLREGIAVDDFFRPPKIVFGIDNDDRKNDCMRLYPEFDAPVLFTSAETAAMVKYADNCFHAAKVTFANEVGLACREFGVDGIEVMQLFCRDTKLNISAKYLRPGAAFGGSCLPKDLRALLDATRRAAVPLPMLAAVLDSNRLQIELVLQRITTQGRVAVGVVGLAFKEGTDDVRESPMVAMVEHLTGKGCAVRVYDSHLSIDALIGGNRKFALSAVPHLADLITSDLQSVVDKSDVLVVCHQLSGATWQGVQWPERLRILDLANVPELRQRPDYEGLYW